MGSYPAWLHCVSSQQETFCEWFPVRHSSIAFHLSRKLFAYSFLSGMIPSCFIAAGNFLRIVSYPTWCRYVSSRQETFRPEISRLRSARNDRTAWLHCVSYRQETIRVQFPIRHGSIAFHLHRKLLANGFLSGMAPLRFITAGNFWRMVSHPAWLHCVSSQQETIRPEISRLRFAPLEMTERHGAIAFHTDRKLFANGFPSGMAPLRFISIGNFPQSVYNSKQTTAAARG